MLRRYTAVTYMARGTVTEDPGIGRHRAAVLVASIDVLSRAGQAKEDDPARGGPAAAIFWSCAHAGATATAARLSESDDEEDGMDSDSDEDDEDE